MAHRLGLTTCVFAAVAAAYFCAAPARAAASCVAPSDRTAVLTADGHRGSAALATESQRGPIQLPPARRVTLTSLASAPETSANPFLPRRRLTAGPECILLAANNTLFLLHCRLTI